MEITARSTSQRTIRIPCYLTRASLGQTEQVFVIIRNLVNEKGKVAWVPRTAVTVLEQQPRGSELKANLTVAVKNESDLSWEVVLPNGGGHDMITVPKTNSSLSD